MMSAFHPRLCGNLPGEASGFFRVSFWAWPIEAIGDGMWIGCSGPHRLHQRSGAEDLDHSLEVVGEDVEAHLRSDLFERLHPEVRRPHPGFYGPEGMFDRRAPDPHDLWRAVQPRLHGFDHRLVLPAGDPALFSGRAST